MLSWHYIIIYVQLQIEICMPAKLILADIQI